MNRPTVIHYRLRSQWVGESTLWEFFWKFYPKVRDAFFEEEDEVEANFELFIAPEGEGGFRLMVPCQHERATCERQLYDLAADPGQYMQLIVRCAEKGDPGKPRFEFNVSWRTIAHSIAEVTIPRIALDGNSLDCENGSLDEALFFYHAVKKLMAALDAEECWAMVDDGVEFQSGYGEYYADELVAFHFRKNGPQTVIIDLESGRRPNWERIRETTEALPDLHGYRRGFLRVVDVPWDRYWEAMENGEKLEQQLFTHDMIGRLFAEQNPRHLKAKEMEKLRYERGGYPADTGFYSID